MSDHDPLVDPVPGDEVQGARQTRQVVYVSAAGKVVYDRVGSRRGQLITSLASWRRWAKGATVTVRWPIARDGVTHCDPCEHDVGLKLDFFLRGQLTGIANQLKPERCSTPSDHVTALALMEVGLDAVLTHGPARELLREVLKKRLREDARS